MRSISVLIDDETLERIKRMQKETDTFSRSEMIRKIVNEALGDKENAN